MVLVVQWLASGEVPTNEPVNGRRGVERPPLTQPPGTDSLWGHHGPRAELS